MTQAFADGPTGRRAELSYIQKSRTLTGVQLAVLLLATCALGSMIAATATALALISLFGGAR